MRVRDLAMRPPWRCRNCADLTARPGPVRLCIWLGNRSVPDVGLSTLVAMCVAQGMILLDNTIVNVALPSIQRELDVNPGNLIWVVNAYVLALASLIMVGGTLGDRYWPQARVSLSGWRSSPRCHAACALSLNESALIAARAAQGVGAASSHLSLSHPG